MAVAPHYYGPARPNACRSIRVNWTPLGEEDTCARDLAREWITQIESEVNWYVTRDQVDDTPYITTDLREIEVAIGAGGLSLVPIKLVGEVDLPDESGYHYRRDWTATLRSVQDLRKAKEHLAIYDFGLGHTDAIAGAKNR